MSAAIDRVADRIADNLASEARCAISAELERLLPKVSPKTGEAAEFVNSLLRGDRWTASVLAPRLFEGETLFAIELALTKASAQ